MPDFPCHLTPDCLQGKVAIVTGAGRSSIGRATAELFASHGATMCICARTPFELEATRETIR